MHIHNDRILYIFLFCILDCVFHTISAREQVTDASLKSRYTRSSNLEYSLARSQFVVKDNHKPVFTKCPTYNPYIKEEEPRGSYVTTVSAVDEDPLNAGGTLNYTFALRTGEKSKFTINSETGEIYTNHVFDHDEPSRNKEVYVIVKATDNGRPALADICSFKISIQDINDNSPIFDKTIYSESVPQDLPVGREVMRISATDIDDGNNSVVTYAINSRSNEKYFRIDERSGIIYLAKPLVPDVAVGRTFIIQATARDSGDVPNSVSTELQINVVDSNKKAPSFLVVPDSPIYLKENFNDYDITIANITATSNMDNKQLLFFLETGRTEQTNKLKNFVLITNNETAQIKLGRALDYESNTEYILQVRVQNKDSLSAVTKVVIKVEDVNDNIPAFMELVFGSVLENEEPGTAVMKVQAVDLDGTEANNIVSYELADHQNLFVIDERTGNITTRAKFDRESNSVYDVKVIAKDNSPSALKKNATEPNSAEQVFRITIEDKNDNAPKFTQSNYVADNILESSDKHKVVIEVKAEDKDTASVIKYSIIDGNIDNAFSIESTIGKIRVNKELDYETRTWYELKVLADDGKFNDTASVRINIENVNDVLPVFVNFTKQITIDEETLVPGCLVKVEAYDPDITDRNAPQHIVYSVDPVKGEHYLSIDKDGCIRLTKKLDRDPPKGDENQQSIVTAADEDGKLTSQSVAASLVIHLNDINDNAPFLNITEVVWPENEPLSDKPIVTLYAEDYDDPTKNGPPFKYRLASNSSKEILESFSIEGDKLYPRRVFDREYQKYYLLSIAITDNGIPPLTGYSTLKVIIGDVNDNVMKPGSSDIYVNVNPSRISKTVIGRIYVDDPDDWDLPDKKFYWENEENSDTNFKLDNDRGDIMILDNVLRGDYVLHFRVTEQSRDIPYHEVTATVTVHVKEIPDEAIVRSGSIRLLGVSAEDFIQTPNASYGKSMKEQLERHLTKVLNVSAENLDIVSILHSPQHKNDDELLLDIRFAAHGSPYYWPERLNTLVTLEQDKLEHNIKMVNVAECMDESVCPYQSCTNFLNVLDTPYVVNTNRTSFVGISAVVEPKCTCNVHESVRCLNGGTLMDDLCQCLEGFEGPHCESLTIGFYGNGWAMYPPFETCNNSELILEITTLQENGLIFYVGPLRTNEFLPVKDFMSLELKNGFPLLLVDYGNGTAQVEQKYKKLSDGNPHIIDINFKSESIELKVDNCAMSTCVKLAPVEGQNKALNVNGPLQIGGTIVNLRQLANQMSWNYTPTDIGFSGCVRNLTYNGKTYDLGTPRYAKNVNLNWKGFSASAAKFGIDSNFLIALLVCLAMLLILLLAVVVHRRQHDNYNDKDMDDIRENIINYEDEGGGEGDAGFDLDVLRRENYFDDPHTLKQKENLYNRDTSDMVPDISGFLENKKDSCDKDSDYNPFDDVRYYAYEGDGNTSRSSLSSLASCTDEGDLKFNYLSNFGPRFRKLADMYGEEPSDYDDQDGGEESWC